METLTYIEATRGPVRVSVSRKGATCQGDPQGSPLVYLAGATGLKPVVVTIGANNATWSTWWPLISAGLSLMVAVYAVRVAMRQSRTADERLRLDFFDRRFKVWEATSAAIGIRFRYITSLTAEDCDGGNYKNTGLPEFQEAEQQARFLFGEEVFKQFAQVRGALNVYQGSYIAKLKVPNDGSRLGQMAANVAEQAFLHAWQAVDEEQHCLSRYRPKGLSLAQRDGYKYFFPGQRPGEPGRGHCAMISLAGKPFTVQSMQQSYWPNPRRYRLRCS